jgi:hypothetical protein
MNIDPRFATEDLNITDEVVQRALRALLEQPAAIDCFGDAAGHDPDEIDVAPEVETFEEGGVLTNNAGLTLTFSDGSEFQLTIVRSR